MTPEQARHLINADSRSTHGPNTNCHACKAIKQHAWEMAHQIAGMTYEYAVQARIQENGQWHQVTEWNDDPNPYKPGYVAKHNERIFRRLVGPTEEVHDA